MKNYKEYEKEFIGYSDIATLILVGFSESTMDNSGVRTLPLKFGGDGNYYAYIVDKDTEIPEHYDLKCVFDSWMKVYDDVELVKTFKASKIFIYRAGDMGCIIQLVKEEN